MAKRNQDIYLTSMTHGRRLLILAVIFLLALSLLGFVVNMNPAWAHPRNRMDMGWVSVIQDLVVFIVPAILSAILFSRRPLSFLAANRKVSSFSLVGIFLIYMISIPALNQLVWWNNQVTLPAFLSEMERTFRQMEEAAQASTALLLSSKSFGGLVVEILVIGLIAPFSEELFFRGTLQRLLSNGGKYSPHLAIWLSAIVFSLFHFQFFGFFPRMILGAFFGYLLYWTGSLWASVAAHALNNTFVVICAFINRTVREGTIPDDFGVIYQGIPWPAIISLILVSIIFISFRKAMFYNSGRLG